MTTLSDIFKQNAAWAAERTAADPGYFPRLAALQAPELLWIGCADSRVPADTITGLQPGAVFVHRNVANLVYAADLNCMSVLQFAIDKLKVRHVVVCGHYGCAGVRAALEGGSSGLVDHWLQPIKDLARRHRGHLHDLPDAKERLDRLCELNVQAQVDNLAHAPIIQNAWERGQEVTIHGWIYGLDNGRLRDLECSRDGIGT